MKNSLSRRLFQKYGLPPRGYQWGATSFLPTQGSLYGHHTGGRSVNDLRLHEQQCGSADKFFWYAALYRRKQTADCKLC